MYTCAEESKSCIFSLSCSYSQGDSCHQEIIDLTPQIEFSELPEEETCVAWYTATCDYQLRGKITAL